MYDCFHKNNGYSALSSPRLAARVYLFVFFRIPPFAGNEISVEISPKFANSERKVNSNSKNEISVNSDRNFGDLDRNSVIFDRNIPDVK